ncbi:LysR family transcriptional regulator [Psychromarinibacter sp. S121]|uniref:LysR family transcriptional regulator n=1 Tax=Psychromarinibacter sp. S121 TaxID=3415127 RepID=UPI003C7E06D3
MSWSLNDVPVFVAVVDHNGITAAADAIGMPKSTVSNAVTRLEHGLGLRLLDRNSRNLRVTSEGETFYRQAQLIMDQVRETNATMAGMTAEPTGRVTVALPTAFCQEVVAPRLAGLQKAYPKLVVDLILTPDGVSLLRDQVDLAVAVGPLDDSELIARTLITGKLIWVASPSYLAAHDIGHSAADIRAHVQICETRYGNDQMPVHEDGRAVSLDLHRGIAHVNNPLVVRTAVLGGAGIAPLPAHYCRDHIARGELVEIGRHVVFDVNAVTLTVVYPGRRLLSPRVRVFLNFLAEACAGLST